MNPAFEYIERRKTTLIGGALGIALFLGFVGQGYREVKRLNIDVNNPKTGACLGLTSEECIAQVTGSDSNPDRKSLNEEAKQLAQANRIGAGQRLDTRQRARQRARRGSSSPSQSTTTRTGPPTSGSAPPTSTQPNSPQRPPSVSPTPGGSGSTPQPTTPQPRPTPAPSSSPTQPPATTAPAQPPPATTPPTPPTTQPKPPPINIPIPPIPPILPKPPVICIPGVGGINCPPGSVQPKRLSGKGPGNEQDPLRPGSDPDKYDIDPTQPSDHVNP